MLFNTNYIILFIGILFIIVVFFILYILLKPNNFYIARRLKFYILLVEFVIFTNICY